jgi:hypothetical protein
MSISRAALLTYGAAAHAKSTAMTAVATATRRRRFPRAGIPAIIVFVPMDRRR